MGKLDGKVAVITGASRGIGKAIAKQFLDEGAKVVLSARYQATLDKAVAELASPNIAGFACDVSSYDSVTKLFEQSLKRFGKIDVWINNAGAAEPFGRIIDTPVEAWYAPIETNIKGTYHGCRAVLPYFLERRSGKIINLAGAGSGTAKFDNTANISGYGASKAAIRRLTFALADEYKNSGLEILLLNPGLVRTAMTASDEQTAGMGKRKASFEIIQDIFGQSPQVAAHLAVKLASNWSDGKNGHYISAISRWRSNWLLLSYPFRKLSGTIDRTVY